MKKLSVALFILTIVLSLATVVSAQQNAFPSKEQCEAAFLSDDYNVYEPKFFGLKDKDPVNGETKILSELESDACVHMLTVGGKKWVVQMEGTELRWLLGADGYPEKPYARNDCGNPIYGISYPVKEIEILTQTVSAPAPTPQPEELLPVPQLLVVINNPIKGLDYYEKEQLPPPDEVRSQEQERPRGRIYKNRYRIAGGAVVLGGIAAYAKYLCLW